LIIYFLEQVEDFTDRSQNVARAVRAEGFETIYKCIHNSIAYLSRFLNGEIQGIELRDHLFGKPMVSTLRVEGTSTSNINETKNNPPTLHNPRLTKKRRVVKNQAGGFHQTEPRGADQVHVPPSSDVPNGVEGTSTSNTNKNKNNPPTGKVHVPPSSNVPNGVEGTSTSNTNKNKNNPPTGKVPNGVEGTSTSNTNKNKNNPPTGKVHVPPSSNVPNGAEGTSTSNINEKKNNPPISRNPIPTKKRTVVKNQVRDFQRTEPYGTSPVHVHPSSNVPHRLASFPPPLTYQSPFATYSTNFMEHRGYVPGHVPPHFGLNPAANPFSQSHHVSQQMPSGYVQTFHQNVVASNTFHHVSPQIPGGHVQTFHQNVVASNPYHGSFLHSSLQGRDYAALHARDYAIHSRRSG